MFADIVGYTALMQQDEHQALSLLNRFKEYVQKLAAEHHGRVIQYYGDGCLLWFNSSKDGVNCAIDLQQACKAADSIPLRIGLHLGEVVVQNQNVFGDGVNLASRIESLGIAGSILISKSIRDQIKNKREFEIKSLGRFNFKNVDEPMEVFAIGNHGLSVPQPNQMKGKLQQQASSSTSANQRFTILVGLVALLIILGLAWVGWFSYMGSSQDSLTESGTELEKTMAVLPLINLNNDDNLEYFSNGVTQEIIDELAKVKNITVAAFSSTFIYRDRQKPDREIAEELNVNYMMSGSSRIFGDSVKLSIELFNPRSNKRIWNGTFNELMANAPMLQTRIAKEVVANLGVQLSSGEKESLEETVTENGEAFRLFLRAKSELSKLSQEGFTNSQRFLEEALTLDPQYAQAHTLLAWTLTLGRSYFMTSHEISTEQTHAEIAPHIEKAIELDPGSSDIYLVRANLNLFHLGRMNDAKQDVDKALELNTWPKVPTDYCVCTIVSTYASLRKIDRAKELAKIAKRVDPGNILLYYDQATIEIAEGDLEEAKAIIEEALSIADSPFYNWMLGWIYYHQKDHALALEYFERVHDVMGFTSPVVIAYLSAAFYQLDQKEAGDKYYADLKNSRQAGNPSKSLPLAIIAAAQEDVDQMFEYLQQAQAEKDYGLAYFINIDPIFTPYLEDSRMVEIRRRLQFFDG